MSGRDENMLDCVALAAFRNKMEYNGSYSLPLNYDKDGVELIYRLGVVSCMKSVQQRVAEL